MNNSMNDFMLELLSDYKTEAFEHIQTIQNGLIQLENEPDMVVRKQLIEVIFRETHSLKGASRVVNQAEPEKLCMQLESHFSLLKQHILELTADYYTLYNKTCDLLSALIEAISKPELKPSVTLIQQIIRQLELALDALRKKPAETINNKPDSETNIKIETETVHVGETEALESKKTSILTHENDTIRISAQKLNEILLQTDEFVTVKNSIEYFGIQFQLISNQISDLRHNKHNHNAISNDNPLYDERDTVAETIKKLDEDLISLSAQFQLFRHTFERQIGELQIDVKKTLLLPLRTLFLNTPKMLRDLCVHSGKTVEFELSGDSIEIDRRILEDLKDPIMHLLRNCIDHGIELPAQRKAKNKPEKGNISIQIKILPDKKIEITIGDDGAGINKNKLLEKAVKASIISPEEAHLLTDEQKNHLIFKSGLSSAEIITDLSGRGLGMSIVEEKILRNGGKIEIESEENIGTRFRITLPQTLNVYRGVVVRVSGNYFSIAVVYIERVIRQSVSEIRTVESKKCIFYADKTIAVVELSELLNLPKAIHHSTKQNTLHLLIVSFAGEQLALVVDKISGEFEGMLKDMGSQLKHVKNITGVTMLGSGKLVSVLNIAELMSKANNYTSSNNYKLTNNEVPEAQKRILIAEDSITIRSMLRSYVESAGYYVKTAVDGLQAYQYLQQERYDLVVSDVEMPRMNGFELTAGIRQNTSYSDLPVVLVTALETADDKQRGLEAGANAYIVKSSFEQSTLLDTIKRLI